MGVWFLSVLVILTLTIPLLTFYESKSKKEGEEYKVDAKEMIGVVVMWAFLGVVFIDGYDTGFWYLASLFVLTSLMNLFKSDGEAKGGFTSLGVWAIIGLIIPFITA